MTDVMRRPGRLCDTTHHSGTRSGLMTVGELSRRTGVSVKNLREYTDAGLIYTVGRSASNYRLFTADALWCVGWIGQMRGMGLTVAEIRDLAHSYQEGSFGPRLAERLRASRQRLHTRIAELEETVRRIDAFETTHRHELTQPDDAVRAFANEYGITLMNDAQAALPPPLHDLHRAILTGFVESGTPFSGVPTPHGGAPG